MLSMRANQLHFIHENNSILIKNLNDPYTI